MAGMDPFEIARRLRKEADAIDFETRCRTGTLRKMAQEAEYAALYGVERVESVLEPGTFGTVVSLRTPGMGCVAFVRWDGEEHAHDVVSGTPYPYEVLRPSL